MPSTRVLVARLLVGLVLTAVALIVIPRVTPASGVAVPPSPVVVQVEPGQTLSEIAARHLPQLPVREGVARIQLANALNTTHVHAGQQLRLPSER